MKLTTAILPLLLSVPMAVAGQTSKSSQNLSNVNGTVEEELTREQVRRARAVNLIEITAGEAVLWDDHEAAVNALSDAADLLWNERPTARRWLMKAWEIAGKSEEGGNSGELRQIWRGSKRSKLRTHVLVIARRHDPQLAESFLTGLTESESSDTKRGEFDDRTDRSEQLLRLALEAVATNPSLAESLAERTLADGISFNLQTVLLRLRHRDARLADRLFDSALTRLAVNSTFREHHVLASYLFQPGQVLTQLPSGSTAVAVVQTELPQQTPAEADPNRARRFLSVVQRAMLSTPLPVEEQAVSAGEFLLLASSLAQPFKLYAPELWPGIAARSEQFAAKLPTAARTSGTNESLETENATRTEATRTRVDRLIAEAEKEVNPIARKLKFAEAALATGLKDYELAQRIAARIEGDEDLRKQISGFALYRAAFAFLEESDLKNAEQIALLIPASSERALTLIAVAQRLASKPVGIKKLDADTYKQRAVELLFEADNSLTRETPTQSIAKIRLGKVSVSNLIDSSQALADFEQAIAIINRLDHFDVRDAAAPRFGIEGFANSTLTVPRVTFGFGVRNALEPLVKADFDLTASTIERLSSPSVRGACRLEVARQILQPTQSPKTRFAAP